MTGKILDDKLMIKDYGIEPSKDFVVVMVTKVSSKFMSIFCAVFMLYFRMITQGYLHKKWAEGGGKIYSQGTKDVVLISFGVLLV